MKPAKFAASIAIYTLTLAWVFTYLREWPATRRVVSWVTASTLVLEIIIIDVQAWRGTTSHFNVGTVLDGVLFTIMGIAIVVQTITAVAVAVALWRQRFADPAIGWALRLGMTITIAGAMTGGLMTQPTREQMDGCAGRKSHDDRRRPHGWRADGGPGLPGTGWSREHGDLRVAHFLGLHALQILPLAALVFARRGWHGHSPGPDGVGHLCESRVALRAAVVAGPARTVGHRAGYGDGHCSRALGCPVGVSDLDCELARRVCAGPRVGVLRSASCLPNTSFQSRMPWRFAAGCC